MTEMNYQGHTCTTMVGEGWTMCILSWPTSSIASCKTCTYSADNFLLTYVYAKIHLKYSYLSFIHSINERFAVFCYYLLWTLVFFFSLSLRVQFFLEGFCAECTRIKPHLDESQI
jgi:hypothetical protein